MLYNLSCAAKGEVQAQTWDEPLCSPHDWLSSWYTDFVHICSWRLVPSLLPKPSIAWSVNVYKTLLHSDFLEKKDFFSDPYLAARCVRAHVISLGQMHSPRPFLSSALAKFCKGHKFLFSCGGWTSTRVLLREEALPEHLLMCVSAPRHPSQAVTFSVPTLKWQIEPTRIVPADHRDSILVFFLPLEEQGWKLSQALVLQRLNAGNTLNYDTVVYFSLDSIRKWGLSLSVPTPVNLNSLISTTTQLFILITREKCLNEKKC